MGWCCSDLQDEPGLKPRVARYFLNHMNRILLLVFLALPLGISAQTTRTINFESLAFEIGQTSTGAALDSSYTFQLGSFGSFAPTLGNVSDWTSNFQSLGQASWDDLFTNFSGTAQLASNSGAFSTANTAYIWGYNTKTIGSGTEWVLLTNTAWAFPDTSAAIAFPDTFTVDLSNGTTAVVGTLAVSGADPYLMTASIAVPEPATYAAVLGAMVLGVVGYRRFRRK
jgi:hypothetical protein